MPEISRFFGITIRMFIDEHNPPHFHAVYAGAEALIGIDPIEVLRGDLPPRAVSMVLEWAAVHQRRLMRNWELLRSEESPHKIAPLRQRSTEMFPRVTGVRHLKDYVLELTFCDGVKANIDFRNRVVGRGGILAPLQDIDFFKQVKVDTEVGTLVWPNEVDFCPDVLYSEATGKPLPVLEATEQLS
jgi:hypothetical protein